MILVLNAGSSSIKAALFDAGGTARLSGSVTEIGGAGQIVLDGRAAPVSAPDHAAALARLLAAFGEAGWPVSGFGAVGHRVVHGGPALTRPVGVDAAVLEGIAACIPLAPLHNPHNLTGIHAMARLAPDLPQVACFDTAFHATNPEVARRYALPPEEEARGLRRYGFHGISYESLTLRLPELLGAPLPRRLLALHLGNGASLCAIRAGRSVATTMGYSPLSGITMGSRTGDIDGNAVLRLAREHGIEGAGRLLNGASGLLGLGGASDMRALRAAGTAQARFAIDHFAYWAVRHAGAMIAAMGGLDAVAFTGGIGENDAEMREAICAGLGFMGVRLDAAANRAGASRLDAPASGEGPNAGRDLPVLIVPAAEEAHIARLTRSVLAGGA